MKKKICVAMIIVAVLLKFALALYLPSSDEVSVLKISPVTAGYWPSTDDKSVYSTIKAVCFFGIRISVSPSKVHMNGNIMSVNIYADEEGTKSVGCIDVGRWGIFDTVIYSADNRDRCYVTLPVLNRYLQNVYKRIAE